MPARLNIASLKRVVIQRFDEILEPILWLLSHDEEEVRKAASLTNDLLLQIMDSTRKEQPSAETKLSH